MAKRQVGNLHNLHIRIQEDDYAKVQKICDSLDITIADYFNKLLESEGYDTLLKYAKMINKDPRHVEVRFADTVTAERFDKLTLALNEAAKQTRAIGTNVSNLIRDIRRGQVSAEKAVSDLEQIKSSMETQKANYQLTGGKIERLIFSDVGIQKVEIIEKFRDYEDDYSWLDTMDDGGDA